MQRVTQTPSAPSAARPFWNNGDGTFTEAAREAGIDNPFWGTSACWLDYDRDGWLDLAIANYVVYSPTRPCSDQGGKRDYCGPQPFPGTVAKLFHNLGPVPPARRGPGRRAFSM
ncbi:MAG: VCBS repeat-containing protein [Planctomycetes bacterium]|nr:VCBS repeat-containing protein [Planctomycetota bacterium]